MSKILVVFGATGQQGSSVINAVLNDADLSKQYAIRAVTRDTSSSSAQALVKRGVEVVSADLDTPSTLSSALKNAHTIFFVTLSVFDSRTKERELAQGHALADAAVSSGARYLIFSTLPHIAKISGGKYTGAEHFDAKAEIEAYIRTLPIKSTFLSLGSFMQNYNGYMGPQPVPDQPGVFAINNLVSPTTRLPLFDVAGDTGKYVNALLRHPDKHVGETIHVSNEYWTPAEMAELMSKVSGKKVVYNRVSREELAMFVAPDMVPDVYEMACYFDEFGYFGPGGEELVRKGWEVIEGEGGRGSMVKYEDFVRENPAPTLT